MSITPIFLLRPTAVLWNLLILLLCIFACSGPVLTLQDGAWTTHLLPSLLVSGAGCLIALLPPRSPRPYCLNAWLALPLAVLLAASTAVCSLRILFRFYQYVPSLPETAVASLAPATVLLLSLYRRHTLSLCGASLSVLVLLNMLLFRTLEHTPPYETAAVFTAVNLGFTLLLSMLLPKALSQKAHPRLHRVLTRIPSLAGGFLSVLSLFLLTLFFFSEFSIRGHALLLAGLVYMAGGMLLWRVRRKSMFLSVLASVLVSGGSFCLHIDLLGYSAPVLLAGVWAAAVLIYVLMDYAPLRFSAVFWADLTLLFCLPSLLPADFPFSVAAFLLFFLPLFAAAAGRFPRGFLRPAAFACILTLILITPSFPSLMSFQVSLFSPEEKIVITIAALNLAALLGRLFALRTEGKKTAWWEYAVLVLLLIPVWYLSTLENLIALNLIAAGLAGYAWPADTGEVGPVRRKSDSIAVLSGIILLSVGLLLFYYFSELTFPAKTFYTGVPGCFLFCAGMWITSSSRPSGQGRRRDHPHARSAGVSPLCPVRRAPCRHVHRGCCGQKGPSEGRRRDAPSPHTQGPENVHAGRLHGALLRPRKTAFPQQKRRSLLPASHRGRERHRPPLAGRTSPKQRLHGCPPPGSARGPLPSGRRNPPPAAPLYFEQGLAPLYAPAAFAILRCDGKNRCLLTGLADEEGKLILP